MVCTFGARMMHLPKCRTEASGLPPVGEEKAAVQEAVESGASGGAGASAVAVVAAVGYPEKEAEAEADHPEAAAPRRDLPVKAARMMRLGSVTGSFSWDG